MTLTEFSYYFRKYSPFALLGLIFLMIIFYAVKLTLVYLNPSTSQPSVVLRPVFGKIPKPQVNGSVSSKGFSYVLDTIEGVPFTATPAAKVYLIPPSSTRFSYLEKIYLMAKSFGFDTELIRHRRKDKEAIFKDEAQELSVDITNFNFTYGFKFEERLAVFDNTVIPSRDKIKNKAVEFLSLVDRYPEELAQGKTNIIYLLYDQTRKKLVPTEEINIAQAVEVDFYRPDIDGFPVVSPQYFNSQNYVVLVFYERGYKVLKAQVRFFERSFGQVGIYPIKTGEEAWKDLINGEGMVSVFRRDISQDKEKKVFIKKMFLGYFDPDNYQEYLQPVYVFLGDNFVAYVPAVKKEYLED